MTNQEWHEWILKMAAGNEAAFEVVYRNTCDDVYRTVSFLVHDQRDVHEIVNEIYIKLWESREKYDPSREFRYWFHGLIVRQVSEFKRGVWRRLRLLNRKKSLEVEPVVPVPEDHLTRGETRHELVQAVRELPLKHREIIILRYYHHYTLEQIAELIGVPLGTVKSRHHHALQKLRNRYVLEGKVESVNAH